jgi:sugar/nucleoside kinase (ribokinase family)
VLDVPFVNLESATKLINQQLGIYCLVVHPTKEAGCAIGGEYFQVDGPFCANPVLTTGAGDNFNAGFCLAQTLGLDPQRSLLLGVATSGYYVRQGKSPDYTNIQQFLIDWQNGAI